MLVFGLEVGGLVLRFVFELDSLAFLEFYWKGWSLVYFLGGRFGSDRVVGYTALFFVYTFVRITCMQIQDHYYNKERLFQRE